MSEQGETPTIQQIIDRSSHCTVEDCTGKVHSAVKAKISDLRLVERELAQMAGENAEIRDALAGNDYASLPSDFPTVRMAHSIRSDRDKFLQQVRDTCLRAEAAERRASDAEEKLAAWEQVWDNVKKDVPDLRTDNKPLAVAATYELQRNALLGCGRDAERLAYLTADHDNAEIRNRRNHLLCRMPVMSRSAACADIDIGLAALAAERKESGNG